MVIGDAHIIYILEFLKSTKTQKFKSFEIEYLKIENLEIYYVKTN